MSVRTPLARDHSTSIIEINYDPQLPKDMFGFPVERKFIAAYQQFLSLHLTQSLRQNEKVAEAIQQGVINTSLPKSQWGIVRNPSSTNKKESRPLLQRMLPSRTTSTRNLHSLNNDLSGEQTDRRRILNKSKSIGNLRDSLNNENENEKTKERRSMAIVGSDMGSMREEMKAKSEPRPVSRGRSNSDLKPYIPPSSPPSPPSTPPANGIFQTIVGFIETPAESPEEIVRNIIRGGIPANYRAELWMAMSGVTQKMPVVKGVYQNLMDSIDKTVYLDSLAYEQIEKDLTRTFPGIDFTPSGHEFQPTLRRILRAYVVRNPVLGYCQSMNFIAGGLLIFMEEEHAFWVLVWIVEELLNGYFTKSMIGLQVDTLLFERLLKKNLPELHKHLSAVGFNSILCTVQWFLCIFLNNLPSEAAFRVWDLVFLSGVKALFEVGLNVMKLHEQQILRKRDPVDIASLLSRSLTCCFDASPLVANNFLKGITAEEVKKLQKDLYAQVQLEAKSRHDTLQMIELLRLSRFDKSELTNLYEEFASLDAMLNDFGINIHIFTRLIPYAFPSWNAIDDFFAQHLFVAFDIDNDSLLDFKDLMLGLSAIYRGQVREKLDVCCRVFGLTQSATRVHRDIFRKLLCSIYKAVERTSDSQILREVYFFEEMFFKGDKNNEGITADVFREFALLQPAIVKCFNLSRPNALPTVQLVPKK